MNNNKKFFQRFCKDYNLPINVFEDSMFHYYMDLYKDFFPKREYESAVDLIETKFGGNVDLWLDYCAQVRDTAINTILESESYKKFISMDLSEYKINGFKERSVYTEETDGKCFISIDLKKANFQALRWMDVIDDYSYDHFIMRMGGDDYIAGSKYLRQVIFGKCNPSRQVTIEKHLMSLVEDAIKNKMSNHGFKLYSFNSDELVYEEDFDKQNILDIRKLVEDVKMMIEKYLNIEVSVEYFSVKKVPVVNYTGNRVDAYVKRNIITGEIKYKKISTTFFPQVYKLIKGIEIEELDRVFFFENQLATFNKPLKLEV